MIELKNISKSYGEKAVFSNFSLSIPKNKTTCLLGVSGKGKTTLLRLIAGLEKPDSGEITGTNGEKLSVMFQDDRLIPFLNVLKNITFTGAEQKNAERLLTAVNLGDELNSSVDSLSGGMKRRVALARALAFPDYSLILLDEPFSGQDEATRKALTELLKTELKGKTALIITHYKDSAELLADNIITL